MSLFAFPAQTLLKTATIFDSSRPGGVISGSGKSHGTWIMIRS
jgi:hypothetical protein